MVRTGEPAGGDRWIGGSSAGTGRHDRPVGTVTSRPVVDADGDRIRAERRAREVVADMHWRGMIVPPLYTRMAAEFQDLIASGDYAAWVASGPSARHTSRPTRRVRPMSPSPI
jgi:hypothetical protein